MLDVGCEEQHSTYTWQSVPQLLFLSSRIPGKTYMIIAFLTVGTMGLSNTSLGYLNYPTQVIFKCCKLIPVMIGGVFIQGKLILRYMYLYTDLTDATTYLLMLMDFAIWLFSLQ